jgi:CheY-like chemotaxis protein
MTEKPCILVLEDEMIIAMFAEMALEEIGCTVVGPVGRVDEALALLEGGRVDAALLDLNLGRGTTSLPVAQALAARNIPFAYMSGDAGDAIPPEDRHRPRLQKPFAGKELQAAVAALLAERGAATRAP